MAELRRAWSDLLGALCRDLRRYWPVGIVVYALVAAVGLSLELLL